MTRPGHAGLAGLLVAAMLALVGCGGADADAGLLRGEGQPRVVPLADATALPDVVDATRRIGVTTLATAPRDGNTVISPSSLAMALAMLTEGARGETLTALEAMFGASGEQRRDAIAALRGALLAYDGDPAAATGEKLPDRPIVHLANQVVVDDQYEPSQAYLDALTDVFDAGVQAADLGSDAGKQVLSAWVKHHTGGLIPETAIEPNPDLRLVLQDVILLAARWQTPFSAHSTGEQPFTLPDGSQVQTETMWGTEQWAYAEVEGWQAIRLPYTEALHADVLLPPAGTDPADASADLLARIAAALDAATPELVVLTLPTLDVGPNKLDLLDILPALRAPVLCADGPDLSGIGPGDLCVLQAAQQAVLKVDEEGTVAAAVTEIGVGESGAPQPERELRFDRPYLFTIAHQETGWPLFLAAIRDPRH
ncbi:MAG: serpin family protein [Actinobacteria bacterium]|nr:serpin family protein [Actinomycetota bacterium]